MHLHLRMSYFVLAVVLIFLGSILPGQALRAGGIAPEDPMVRITSAPVDFDKNAVLDAVSKDVSEVTGIDISFITYFWQTFDTIVYEGKSTSAPVFVDLYVPSFFSDADVKGMLNAVADALVKHAGADRKWLFIHTHFPNPEQVYIAGGITSWDTYRGKPIDEEKVPRPQNEREMGGFLFNDAAFVFQSLWRFGLIASGAGDLGEMLTATGNIKDFDKESWYREWTDIAKTARTAAVDYAAAGHELSARQGYFRATNYFRASSIYLYGQDVRGEAAWQNGRDAFLKAAELSKGHISHVRIPYEDTTLPGYVVRPASVENTEGKHPLLLIQTGLDGTAEDLYSIIAKQAAAHGYTCLVFEGPGQGEMIIKQKRPFRYDWEKVVTPVVDYALTLPDVDPDRIAIIGYSMGGYLVPRALAYEKRIKWGIVDGGVFSVFDGTMTKFSDEVATALEAGDCDTVNSLVQAVMDEQPDLDQFISQMFWTFQVDTPCELLTRLQRFSMEGEIDKIDTEMLVVGSTEDQVAGSAEQARIFYAALDGTKTYLEFDDTHGAQFHCQLGAPLASGERILNWLDEQAKP